LDQDIKKLCIDWAWP